jgi:hypothetical protein
MVAGSLKQRVSTKEELQLALRNKGDALEALRYPVTLTGLHYRLVHAVMAQCAGLYYFWRV